MCTSIQLLLAHLQVLYCSPNVSLTRIRVGAEPMPAAQHFPAAVAPPGSYRICSAAETAHIQDAPKAELALSGAQATSCVLWSACTSSWLGKASCLSATAVALAQILGLMSQLQGAAREVKWRWKAPIWVSAQLPARTGAAACDSLLRTGRRVPQHVWPWCCCY